MFSKTDDLLKLIDLLGKTYDFTKDDNTNVIKDIKGVKSGKLKVKTWFCDKDSSSVNLFSKTYGFIQNVEFA